MGAKLDYDLRVKLCGPADYLTTTVYPAPRMPRRVLQRFNGLSFILHNGSCNILTSLGTYLKPSPASPNVLMITPVLEAKFNYTSHPILHPTTIADYQA